MNENDTNSKKERRQSVLIMLVFAAIVLLALLTLLCCERKHENVDAAATSGAEHIGGESTPTGSPSVTDPSVTAGVSDDGEDTPTITAGEDITGGAEVTITPSVTVRVSPEVSETPATVVPTKRVTVTVAPITPSPAVKNRLRRVRVRRQLPRLLLQNRRRLQSLRQHRHLL